ncbi:DUF924 family protein [Vibrio sp. WXL103]|uniref:DUF924 family protein n=1 Tax=Vibrio sp. WXL103 TaxID=3450710 RepID=UPI003EC82985
MYQEIIQFWFSDIEPRQWWQKDSQFDRLVEKRFGHLHQQAMAGELYTWRPIAQGSLAEIIILDQFSRNIFRDTPQAFAGDSLALALAQRMVEKGQDLELDPVQRRFVYLPYMHSESMLIHTQAVALYERLDNPESLSFEFEHKAIIDRFGRYPHRNSILGRESTPQELEFLKQPKSGF